MVGCDLVTDGCKLLIGTMDLFKHNRDSWPCKILVVVQCYCGCDMNKPLHGRWYSWCSNLNCLMYFDVVDCTRWRLKQILQKFQPSDRYIHGKLMKITHPGVSLLHVQHDHGPSWLVFRQPLRIGSTHGHSHYQSHETWHHGMMMSCLEIGYGLTTVIHAKWRPTWLCVEWRPWPFAWRGAEVVGMPSNSNV